MISTSKLLLTLMALSLFLLPVFTSKVDASSEDMAASAISRAEEAVASAYETVLEAQRARADVSELLDELNVAGEHLAGAYMFYRLENFDGAVYSADLSFKISEEVRNEAGRLKIEAYGSWITGLWVRITGSIIGMIAVVFGSFCGWRFFKRRYYGRVLRMKPEVAKNES